MNTITIRAMIDETTKIASAAGVAARYAKTVVKSHSKAAWQGVKKGTKEAPGNVYKTLRDMGSPFKSTKRGIRSEFRDIKKKGIRGANLGHAMTVGGAAASAPEALSKEDRSGRGRGRARRATSWAAEQAGGFIGAKHGLPGAIAGTMVANKLTNK